MPTEALETFIVAGLTVIGVAIWCALDAQIRALVWDALRHPPFLGGARDDADTPEHR